MSLEELDNSVEIPETANPELHPITVIHGDRATVEERPELRQDTPVPAVLDDTKFGEHLPAEPHRTLAIEPDMEAPFPVNEPDYPLRIQSFLLIACTQRVFTVVYDTLNILILSGRGGRKCDIGSVGFTGFPAYGRILLRQCSYLKRVRVTPALCRRFAPLEQSLTYR